MPQYLSPGVYIEEKNGGTKPMEMAGTSVVAFVGFTERRPEGNHGEPLMVTNWTQFQREFSGFVPGAFLPLSVYGYFLNGGSMCFVQSVMTVEEAAQKANINGAKLPKPAAQLTSKGDGVGPSLEAQSQTDGTVTVTVADPAPGAGGDDLFKVVVRGPDGAEESFDNLTLGRAKGARNVVEVVNRESKLIKLRELETTAPIAERRPAIGTYTIEAPKTETTAIVSPRTFAGDVTARIGLGGLEAVEEITIVS